MKRVLNCELDGTVLHATIGRTIIPVLGANYGDNLNPEFLSFAGSQKIDAQTLGTYKTDQGSLKLAGSIFRAELLPRLPRRGFGNLFLPIVFSWVHPMMGNDSDLLHGCRLIMPKGSFDNTAKPQEIELGFSTTQIYWTEKRITVNLLDTTQPIGQYTI